MIFARDSNSWGLFAQFSSLVHLLSIYTYLSSVMLTPPVAFPFLSFHLFQHTIERTIVLFSKFLLTQPQLSDARTRPLKGFLEVLPWFCRFRGTGSKLMSHFTASHNNSVLFSCMRALLPDMICFFVRPSSYSCLEVSH